MLGVLRLFVRGVLRLFGGGLGGYRPGIEGQGFGCFSGGLGLTGLGASGPKLVEPPG